MSEIILNRVLEKVKNTEIQKLLLARAIKGLDNYDSLLVSDNDRDCEKDLLEELLDCLMYCKQCEIEGGGSSYSTMFGILTSLVVSVIENRDDLVDGKA